MARRDRWTNDFAAIKNMPTPWPETMDYINGREEASRLSIEIQRLVSIFKNNPRGKAPRNGDMAYHMLAYRYGYNNASSGKSKKKATDQDFTGGLFVDVYENPEILGRYDSAELRTNKVMVEMGKAFYATLAALPSDLARRHMLKGFKTVAEDQHFNIYSVYPPDQRPPAILPLSEVKPAKVPAPAKIPEPVVVIDDVPDTLEYSEPSSSSSSSSDDVLLDRDRSSELILIERSFDEEIDPFPLAQPTVSGITFQQDTIRQFANYQQTVREKNPNLSPTFFDLFHQTAVSIAQKSDMKISDVVSKIIKLETVKFYEVSRDSIFALICGYGAGEEHHAQLEKAISSMQTVDANFEGIMPNLYPILYQSGFMGAFNRFFLSWEIESYTAISNQDIFDADSVTMLHRLQYKNIVNGVIKAVVERNYSSNDSVLADPNYSGFMHFIKAGILSAVNFLKRFIENKSGMSIDKRNRPRKYHLWFSTFTIFFLGWHVYMRAKNAVSTNHVESIKRKLALQAEVSNYKLVYNNDWRSQYQNVNKTRLTEMKPKDAIGDYIGERNAVVFITRLDPDNAYYSRLNQTLVSTVDLITQYFKEKFGVHPQTDTAGLSGPRYLTVAWQTRAIQMFNVMPVANFMLRSHTGSPEKYLFNVASAMESEIGGDYADFYQKLGRFAQTFSEQDYKELMSVHYHENAPAFSIISKAGSNRARYAALIDSQINIWLTTCRMLFDPVNFITFWHSAQTFWLLEERPIQGGNILSEILSSAHARKIREEQDKFLRRYKFLQQYGTIELPYIEKNYALIIEIITAAYMLTASLSEEDGETLSDIHAELNSEFYDDRNMQIQINDVMNKFWMRRKTNYVYPWISDEARQGLTDQLADIKISDTDRNFFRSRYASSSFTRLAMDDIASQLENLDIFRDILTTVYLVEMYANCNAFATDIIRRNWNTVITFGDVYENRHMFDESSKKTSTENEEDLFTYFIMLQEAKNEKNAIMQQPTVDDEEEEEEEDPFAGEYSEASSSTSDEPEPVVPARPAPEPEEPPVIKKSRAASSSSSSSQQPSSFFEPAFSTMRGKWYSLMLEAEQLDKEATISGQDRRVYSDGESLGSNFSQDLVAFVKERFPNDHTLNEKYANIRSYAINQLSNIYNELEQRQITAAIIDGDFNNPVSQRHEVEIVRKLLTITQPVAERIYYFDGKKDVFMLGFINGYEKKTAEIIDIFEGFQAPEGGGRKSAPISASISSGVSNEGTLAGIVEQLEHLSDSEITSTDVNEGRRAGDIFAAGVQQYAKEAGVSYATAFSRAYIDLENYYDKLMRRQSAVNFVQTGKFVKVAAKAIQNYTHHTASFMYGFLLALDKLHSMKDTSRTRAHFVNNHDSFFKTTASPPDIASIIAAARRAEELALEGVGFSDKEFNEIIEGITGTASIKSLSLTNTNVTSVEAAFTAFPTIERFTSINNSIIAGEFAAVFDMPSVRAHLVALNVEVHPMSNTQLTGLLQMFNDFFENTTVLRDVELELNLPTQKNTAENNLAISYLYNGLMKSSSIRTFYCQGVYPFRYDTIHQDSISKHLKKNRTASISARHSGHMSKKKAREILHHGSVHGHPLSDAQRRFFGAMSQPD